jgi:enoyl-CoA hydratase
VLTEQRGRTLLVTLNRPQALNAINQALVDGLLAAVRRLDEDPTLTNGVLTGAGGRAFSAGMDLKAFSRGEDMRGIFTFIKQGSRKPLVAAVEGYAFGGGFELVLACDLVVAAEGATFALPEVKRGLVARGGGALSLPERLPRPIALELLLTGRSMTAERAAHFGLVNAVVPDGGALEAALALAGEIAGNAPLAVAASKEIATEVASWPPHERFARQELLTDPVFASADAAEGARAFSEKRAPVWTGR